MATAAVSLHFYGQIGSPTLDLICLIDREVEQKQWNETKKVSQNIDDERLNRTSENGCRNGPTTKKSEQNIYLVLPSAIKPFVKFIYGDYNGQHKVNLRLDLLAWVLSARDAAVEVVHVLLCAQLMVIKHPNRTQLIINKAANCMVGDLRQSNKVMHWWTPAMPPNIRVFAFLFISRFARPVMAWS